MGKFDGLSVKFDVAYHAATIRYFDAASVQRIGPFEVPPPLRALCAVSAAQDSPDRLPTLVAWRGPRESLFLTPDRALFDALERQWLDSDTGCCVPQSEGICIMSLRGASSTIADLLQRLGAPTCVPALGEARTSRIAELAVTAICVHEGEVLLAVERVYADHLQAWIEATLADS